MIRHIVVLAWLVVTLIVAMSCTTIGSSQILGEGEIFDFSGTLVGQIITGKFSFVPATATPTPTLTSTTTTESTTIDAPLDTTDLPQPISPESPATPNATPITPTDTPVPPTDTPASPIWRRPE